MNVNTYDKLDEFTVSVPHLNIQVRIFDAIKITDGCPQVHVETGPMKVSDAKLASALDAFWARLVAEYPAIHHGANTGDVPPDVLHDLDIAARVAVNAWLELNQPTTLVFLNGDEVTEGRK